MTYVLAAVIGCRHAARKRQGARFIGEWIGGQGLLWLYAEREEARELLRSQVWSAEVQLHARLLQSRHDSRRSPSRSPPRSGTYLHLLPTQIHSTYSVAHRYIVPTQIHSTYSVAHRYIVPTQIHSTYSDAHR